MLDVDILSNCSYNGCAAKTFILSFSQPNGPPDIFYVWVNWWFLNKCELIFNIYSASFKQRRENNSGSNSLRESSACCAGLFICKLFVICDKGQNSNNIFPRVFPQSEIVCRHFERHLAFKRFRVYKKIQKQVLISPIPISGTCYCWVCWGSRPQKHF